MGAEEGRVYSWADMGREVLHWGPSTKYASVQEAIQAEWKNDHKMLLAAICHKLTAIDDRLLEIRDDIRLIAKDEIARQEKARLTAKNRERVIVREALNEACKQKPMSSRLKSRVIADTLEAEGAWETIPTRGGKIYSTDWDTFKPRFRFTRSTQFSCYASEKSKTGQEWIAWNKGDKK